FCDAARVLLAEGADPAARFVMRHANSATDAMRSTVGAAAKLTVSDDGGGKPIFKPWSPYDRPELHRSSRPCVFPTRRLSRHPQTRKTHQRRYGGASCPT